ncbi:hypothetical protein ACN47E_008701 [Coniothyrium glycines]
MTTYQVIVQETPSDLAWLKLNGYNLAVAKSVITGGRTVTNTIYGGSLLGPTMSVSWTEIYGMNYTVDVPTPGAQVTVSGDWQKCVLGQGYKLNSTGNWDSNTGDPKNEASCVNALNEFSSDARIIVGTQDPKTGEWVPIFYSQSSLAMQGYGAYQPTEGVQLWYGSNQQPGTVIATQDTKVEPYNMGVAPHYFQYDSVTGDWTDQNSPYAPSNVSETLGNPIIKIVAFTVPVTAIAKFVTRFSIEMNDKGWTASATAKSTANVEYTITMSKKNKDDLGGTDPVADINAVLKSCKSEGVLPSHEVWTIV